MLILYHKLTGGGNPSTKQNKMTAIEKIQEVKRMMVSYINADRWNENSKMQLKDEMLSVVEDIRIANLCFVSDIATSVVKYQKCSEKQAYWLAKTAVENELTQRINYQFEN
jgi:hypothetical protein